MRRRGRSSGEAGFVLLDALFAAALLALVGTVVLVIGGSLLSNEALELDRSVALVTLEMYAKTLQVVGAEGAGKILPAEDGVFVYSILPSSDSGTPLDTEALKAIRLEARSTTASGGSLSVEFLAPARRGVGSQ